MIKPIPRIFLQLLTMLVIGLQLAPAMAENSGAGNKNILAASPRFQLHDLGNKQRQLREWSGQPLLINYWATWCAPCLKEMPELDAFSKEQSGVKGGVRVLGIAADDPDAVRAFAKRLPVTFPILIETISEGGQGSVSLFGHNGGMVPYSVLLNAQGKVLHSKAGPVSRELLESWLADVQH